MDPFSGTEIRSKKYEVIYQFGNVNLSFVEQCSKKNGMKGAWINSGLLLLKETNCFSEIGINESTVSNDD